MLRNKRISLAVMGAGLAMATNLAMAGFVDDTGITAQVKAKYLAHPAMSVWDIGVSTTDGHVKLVGHANSNTQMDAAISIATGVEGVVDVDVDDLDVEKSEHPARDAKISAKIEYELVKSKILENHQPSPLSVNVETVNRNVYLSGKVKDSNQQATVVDTAYSVKNVKSVTSFLEVEK